MTSYEIIAVVPEPVTPPKDLPLRFVQAHGYTAVLSSHPKPLISLPMSRKDALQSAAQRQAWLEGCMPLGTVLPLCPNVFLSDEDIPSLITANQPLFDNLAVRLAGKVQFQIMIGWDAQGVLTKFRDAPELAGLFSADTLTQEALTTSLASLSARLCRTMTDTLEDVADDILPLPVVPDILFNAAVLQNASQVVALDAALERIDAIWTEGLQIKQVGPAPATSFASIIPQQITTGALKRAARMLGCDLHNAPQAIATARRAALLQSPAQANEIRRSAAILEAAARVGPDPQSFILCTTTSNDQAAFLAQRKVA